MGSLPGVAVNKKGLRLVPVCSGKPETGVDTAASVIIHLHRDAVLFQHSGDTRIIQKKIDIVDCTPKVEVSAHIKVTGIFLVDCIDEFLQCHDNPSSLSVS